MPYVDDFQYFLSALNVPEAEDPDQLPAASAAAHFSAAEEGANPFTDLQQYAQDRIMSHRLAVFGREMQQFIEQQQVENQLEAMEARFAAMDAAQGTTFRMDRINKLKQACLEAEQSVWADDGEFETGFQY
jgi:hypothetical protein